MATSVKYRDLPGGPREIKFADEISRHSLCGKCGMLSVFMYKDPQGHIFCKACLYAQSEQYSRHDIYCEYERKNIDIGEMEEAFDLVNMLREQYVQCPNIKKCGQQVHLKDLQGHYVKCQPDVKCSSCGTQVQSNEWDKHNYACSRRGIDPGAPKKASTSRQAERKSPLSASSKLDTTLADAMPPLPKFQNSSGLTKSLYPADQLKEVARSTPGLALDQQIAQAGDELCSNQPKPEPSASAYIIKCPYCERGVKDTNMKRHLAACSKSPLLCPFCDKFVQKENKLIHEQQCESNPKNRPTVKETDKGKECHNPSPKNAQSNESYASALKSTKGSVSKPSSSGRGVPERKGTTKDTPKPPNNIVSTQPKAKDKKVHQKEPRKTQAKRNTRGNSTSKACNAVGFDQQSGISERNTSESGTGHQDGPHYMTRSKTKALRESREVYA